MFTKGHNAASLQFALAGVLIANVFVALSGIAWNTFLGGNGTDEGADIAVDGNGNSYVIGYSEFGWGSPVNAHADGYDATIARINSSGIREWHTFVGGTGWDFGEDIALDTNGNLYVTGVSNATWGTPVQAYAGYYEVFVAKYSPDGVLQWNTFLGGPGDENGFGIATDANGNVYVTGYSGGGWETTPLHAHSGGGSEAFIAKLNSNGELQWHTFYGEEYEEEIGYDIDVTAAGDIFVVGESDSNWGTPIHPHYGCCHSDAFVAKFTTDGALQWNTFMGGEHDERGAAIGVDQSGNAYITGFSWWGWGTPLYPYGGGLADAFVAKLDADGNFEWHTFLGGPDDDTGRAIALDESGNIFVTGYSESSWGTPIQPFAGYYDAFVTKLNSNGTRLVHTFLGGYGDDDGYGIAVNLENFYVTGKSSVTWGNPISNFTDAADAFVATGGFNIPLVSSIIRVNSSPTNLDSVSFGVTFSESVTGVNAADFRITTTGLTGTSITGVSGSNDIYTVTVNTGSGNGTIRLDVVDDNSIIDTDTNPLGGSSISDGDFSDGELYSIVKTAPRPSVPTLISPASGMLVNTLQPTLDWKDSDPAADHYQLQVATNNNFTSLVMDDTDLVTSSFPFTSDLLPGKLYHWRVKAFNVLDAASAWSSVWTFKTPLAQPTLLLPAPNASLLTDRPAFSWEAVDGATQYILQVSPSNTFASLLVNATLNVPVYNMLIDLPQNQPIFWRVRAKNTIVTGNWSDVRTLTSGNPPSVPVLVSPANNSLSPTDLPLLKWRAVTVPMGTDFKHYELQVDDNVDFSSPEAEDTSVTNPLAPQFQLTEALAHNTTFHWRVRAVNTYGLDDHVSAWSTVWTFRTKVDAPALVSPPNGFDALTLRPEFDWDVPTGTGTITGYTLQISKNNTFTQIIHTGNPVASNYIPNVDLPKGLPLHWRVLTKGANGPSAWSASRSFISANSPSTPVLSLPASNALLADDTPLLKWSAVNLPALTDFLRYEVQVDNDANFSSLLMDDTSITDQFTTQIDVSPAFAHNTTFFWRVRAVNDDDEVSNWSVVRTFRMKVDAPTLLAPINGDPVATLKPTLDWDAPSGTGTITNYSVQISTSPTFNVLLVNSTTVSTAYTVLTNLPAGQTLYWRVKTNGANGPSVWVSGHFVTP